jgi:hypothetical protein
MERNRQLAELSRVIEGRSSVKDLVSSNVSPVLPMNRYKYRLGPKGLNVKAGSRLPQKGNRIVLHPERIEKARRLAELSRFIRGRETNYPLQ